MLWGSRTKRQDFDSFLRTVAELTDPEGQLEVVRARKTPRFARSFPVLIVPYENDQFAWEQCSFGLSQDISLQGMGLVITRRVTHERFVVGIWPINELLTAASSQPGFLRAELRNQMEIGAGFWRLGLRFVGILDESHAAHRKLVELAKALLPPEQLRLYKRSREPRFDLE